MYWPDVTPALAHVPFVGFYKGSGVEYILDRKL